MIERWLAGFDGSVRTRNQLLIQLHGILGRARKACGLQTDAAAEVERFPQKRTGGIDVFSPEEVWALVRAAATEQDGALFLTAAFTGLRMGELLALRWRDVDFPGSVVRVRASYYLVRERSHARFVARAIAGLKRGEDAALVNHSVACSLQC